jgi:hypothetical protein
MTTHTPEDLLKLKSFDAVATAEAVVGERNELSDDLALALHVRRSAAARQVAKATRDTYYGMPYESLLVVAFEMGFEPVYQETWSGMPRKSFYREMHTEQCACLWHPQKHLFLFVESCGARTSGATLYFCGKRKDPTVWPAGLHASGCGERVVDGQCSPGRDMPSTHFIGHFDAREAMRATVANAEKYLTWDELPRLERKHHFYGSLLTWWEVPDDYKDYDEASANAMQKRFTQLPEHVQEELARYYEVRG